MVTVIENGRLGPLVIEHKQRKIKRQAKLVKQQEDLVKPTEASYFFMIMITYNDFDLVEG